ncbi:hypothetical protein [Brevundimonas sp. NIBR11]|uniref:hypothetical protein n=1 Tax=Brevundimonas sp. NIBR11 TaxID=3015999 RepID=UPI0022F0E14C|nr:hypothetical protein [Brevundimonas sp. NIBR11]WGM30810.1 hypothetical protein KKHFBJBL_01044 [Brevundimonas sp. NIBR11]
MDEAIETSGRNRVPPEVWEAVRDDYIAGLSGPDCCRRHGVTLSALRDRAARHGWRRTDQPWIPPQSLDPRDEGRLLEEKVYGNLDMIEWSDLSEVADGRMMRAVLRGDAAEFMRWHKVCEIIRLRQAEVDRWKEEDAARGFNLREAAREVEAAEAEPDSTDYLDSETDESLEDQGPVKGFTVTREGKLVRKRSHVFSPCAGAHGEETGPPHPFGLPVAGSVAVSPEFDDPFDPPGSVAGRGG